MRLCPTGFLLAGNVSGQEWSSTNCMQECLRGSGVEEVSGLTGAVVIYRFLGALALIFCIC